MLHVIMIQIILTSKELFKVNGQVSVFKLFTIRYGCLLTIEEWSLSDKRMAKMICRFLVVLEIELSRINLYFIVWVYDRLKSQRLWYLLPLACSEVYSSVGKKHTIRVVLVCYLVQTKCIRFSNN